MGMLGDLFKNQKKLNAELLKAVEEADIKKAQKALKKGAELNLREER